MEKSELEKLIELSKEGHLCPHKECCEYQKYNECFNHAHVLCPNYENYKIKKEK